MPPTRSYAEFPVKPVNPHLPLPLPGSTKQTGLLCPSCIKRHSTSYFKPSRQSNEPLIGVSVSENVTSYRWELTYMLHTPIKCRAGSYIRSYSLAQATDAVLAHNLSIQERTLNNLTTAQERADHQFAMQVSRLINGDMPGANNMALNENGSNGSKKKALPSNLQCNGHNNRFATGHTNRRNAGCAIKACRHCCEQLKPANIRCSKHNAMKKTKPTVTVIKQNRDAGPTNSAAPNSTQQPPDNVDTPSTDHDPTLTQGPPPSQHQRLTQASLTFSSPLTAAQKQAQEREDKDHARLAENTITFVVWGGFDDEDPLAFETWRVYAPRWPDMSLNTSDTLMEHVRNKFGVHWNGDLRVWIPEEKTWVKMQTSIVEGYNPTYCRILIVFPGIKLADCKELEANKELVRTMTSMQKMDMVKVISPLAYKRFRTPTPMKHTEQYCVISDEEEEEDRIESPSSSLPAQEGNDIGTVTNPPAPTPQLPSNPPAPTPQLPSSPSVAHAAKTSSKVKGWPTSPRIITMESLLRFFTLTLEPLELTNQAAFKQVYGTDYKFKKSTVSKYHRWIESITPKRFSAFIKENGKNCTVTDGLDFFKAEWKDMDK
ncbi:uncharacterized protein MELLADRAFT_110203 [Melampsora larici-populina 98AG31]|uniref:Uncharacterized protein n=1 Tax=Melampsora larici-populina (strain 98AG31 / pathotype 3-4-7) TaxID=747676 RepID=F4RZ03_MELLP|nr:uncharacterized protein MELLADRAFT_110203 [Melampsora larici-populina 98AG31]EGG02411.1 hypothetical protein MELLADRAFT_110203 [Melampsora larici-populina 98AG31]